MHGKSMLAVSFVILLLVVVLSANAVTLKAKDRTYQAQEQELKRQIEEEKERSQEIDKLEQYVGTDEYVEERDRVFLIWVVVFLILPRPQRREYLYAEYK